MGVSSKQFCQTYFYDEESYLKHLNSQHYKCNICGEKEKFRFYGEYNNLQKHYEISHYACKERECLEKAFVAFASQAELELHNQKFHPSKFDNRKLKTLDLTELTGFHFDNNPKNAPSKLLVMI